MTQQHPIVPPPDKIHNWIQLEKIGWSLEQIIALAAQWGSDQELEACCEWLSVPCPSYGRELRNARRPKPPSLKEQALDDLDGIAAVFRMSHGGDLICDKIRRALEALPND
jgi:hypothetical protein